MRTSFNSHFKQSFKQLIPYLLNNKIIYFDEENKKYKEVIDKAIEYINASYFDGSGMCANDLLEILKGSDSNENN